MAFRPTLLCWDCSYFLSIPSFFPQTHPQIQHSKTYLVASQQSSYGVAIPSSEVTSSQPSTEMIDMKKKDKCS